MKTTQNLGVLVLALAFGATGCATTLPPQDLVTARNVYDRASKGPAQQLDPADLHVAKQQLDVAEAAFRDDGDTQNTRDQAYLAARKAELAEVMARTLAAKQAEAGVVDAMHADQAQAVANTCVSDSFGHDNAWLHVVHGEVTLGDLVLATGDGAGIVAERAVSLTARRDTELLLFDFGVGPASSCGDGARAQSRELSRRS